MKKKKIRDGINKMDEKENTYLSLRRVSNRNLKNKGKFRDGIDEMDNKKNEKYLPNTLKSPTET